MERGGGGADVEIKATCSRSLCSRSCWFMPSACAALSCISSSAILSVGRRSRQSTRSRRSGVVRCGHPVRGSGEVCWNGTFAACMPQLQMSPLSHRLALLLELCLLVLVGLVPAHRRDDIGVHLRREWWGDREGWAGLLDTRTLAPSLPHSWRTASPPRRRATGTRLVSQG